MNKLFATEYETAAAPVRSNGVRTRGVSGTMPKVGRYESTLEADFMLLVRFDASIDLYTPQPVTIRYRDRAGKPCRYTPDGLVEYRTDWAELRHEPPLLVEIKYREEFAGEWAAWRERARAAQHYADEQGWHFAIYTEREIRSPMLANARFLLPYLRRTVPPEIEEWVLDRLSKLSETTPTGLIQSLYQNKWNQAAVLPVVWRLMAERSIGFDFLRPLTMQSTIWSIRPEPH